MRLIADPLLVARYVARAQGVLPLWRDYTAIGLLNSDEELTAGAVFHGYVPQLSLLMQVAGDRFSPIFLAAVCDYAFNQQGCKRITGLIDVGNEKSRRWAEAFGAKLEGVMREASPRGDVCVYGLLRADAAKWLTPRNMRKLDCERMPA